MLRRIVERLSQRKAFKRRFPAAFGHAAIYVSPDAGLKYWTTPLAEVDPLLLATADQIVGPGDCVWDVGANVGMFTFAAAVKAGQKGKVLAVEADTWLVDLLRRSSRIIQPVPTAPVDVLPAAADMELGLATFQIAKRGRASNALIHFGQSQMGGVREAQRVVAVNLDWLLEHFSPPQVVKIDVEGAEIRVLQGAKRVLGEARPAFVIEVAEANADDVGQLLHQYDYDLFDAAISPAQRRPLPNAPWDLIAVPRENINRARRITAAATTSGALTQPT